MSTQDEIARVIDDGSAPISVVRPSSRTLLIGLLGVLVALLLLDGASRVAGGGLIARFSLGGQSTVANWWASIQLLLLAALLGLVAIHEKTDGYRRAGRALGFGAGFAVVLSLEEIAGLAESIPIGLLRSGLVSTIAEGRDTLLVVALVGAVVLVALALPGIVDLLKRRRSNMLFVVLGAFLMFGGGAAIDIADLLEPSHMKAVVEDLLRFLGLASMVWAAYRMLGSHDIRIRRR